MADDGRAARTAPEASAETGSTALGSGREERLRALVGSLADPDSGEVDRLVYERVRLGILSALAVSPSLTFSELRDLLQTSDGNLSVHARKLEDAGYLECTKSFADRVPRTEYALTRRGRRALERYLDHMEALIHAMRPE